MSSPLSDMFKIVFFKVEEIHVDYFTGEYTLRWGEGRCIPLESVSYNYELKEDEVWKKDTTYPTVFVAIENVQDVVCLVVYTDDAELYAYLTDEFAEVMEDYDNLLLGV